MFWKIKTTEYKELDGRIISLQRKIDLLEIDLSLMTEKLAKAISKRAIKIKEEQKTEAEKVEDGFDALRKINKPQKP